MEISNSQYSPPWWSYLISIGFILGGIFFIKLWKKSKNPYASINERAFTEWNFLIVGSFLLISGIMYLIIEIYQECTGWVAK